MKTLIKADEIVEIEHAPVKKAIIVIDEMAKAGAKLIISDEIEKSNRL